jgi:ADP-ribose pyrophosphatase YjhB (NUDIX family)
MFRREREQEFSSEAIDSAVQVLRSYAAETIRGAPKALPLELREAVQALVVEPAVEIIITDEHGRYLLVQRPPNDSEANKRYFGEGRFHLPGGFLKPNRTGAKSVGPIGTAVRMAREETGLKVVPISGPIAMYQWTRTKEHPTGWPLALVFVFKVVGGELKEGTKWVDPDKLPDKSELLQGNAGEIQRRYMEVYQKWRQDPETFIDLNQKTAEEGEESTDGES